MLGTNPSWGVSVVGTRHENHGVYDVPVPDVAENHRGQIFNNAVQAPYLDYQPTDGRALVYPHK